MNAGEREQQSGRSASSGWAKAIVPGLLVTLVSALFATAFIWPMTQADPHDIPMAVAGPEEQRAAIEQGIAAQKPDLFDLTEVADRDAAVEAIEQREVAGAVVVGDEGVEFLTASAAGPQIAQLLNQAAGGLEQKITQQREQAMNEAFETAKEHGATADELLMIQEQGRAQQEKSPVVVTDVVSGGENAFAANLTMLPALIGGMMGGALSMLMVKRPLRRIATIVTAAAGSGLMGAAILGPWFDLVPGDYWLHALALGAGALAISSVISGLGSLFGYAGMGIGVLAVLLIGTPWGGIMVASEFLPGGMASLGASMPTGTMVSLMKSLSYFPAAATGGQWGTLGLWILGGLTAIVIGAVVFAKRNASAEPASLEAPLTGDAGPRA
ncbi:hypothetical protein [Leucobacter chinensis]|uniref:hypothetical protein n=1 Tax=Leucobacter chinensis TaxID=2851010 RepID=UPI001C2442B9|nr:hypothetical protein [Leucobacter chinensis]